MLESEVSTLGRNVLICLAKTDLSQSIMKNYYVTVRKKRRATKIEYMALLICPDPVTGVRRQLSKKASNFLEAKRIATALENKYLAEFDSVISWQPMTLSGLVEHCKRTRYCEPQYDSQGRKLIGVRGKRTLDGHMMRLEAFFGNILLSDITVAHLRAYRHERVMSKKSNGERLNVTTVNRELSTLRAMLNEALVNDWIAVNPFSKARPGELIRIADERKREIVLTSSEEEKLLNAFDKTRSRRRMKPMIIAALDTGARKGELLRIRWPDVDFEACVIKNVKSYKGKSVAFREVPLTARLRTALLNLLEERSGPSAPRKPNNIPEEFLFRHGKSRLQYHWDKIRAETDLTHVHFHDLRHTTGTRLAPHMELALVGHVLGHTDPKTTLRYVNATRTVINKAARILNEFNSATEPTDEK